MVSITAHGGFINGVLEAIGRRHYALPTGGVYPSLQLSFSMMNLISTDRHLTRYREVYQLNRPGKRNTLYITANHTNTDVYSSRIASSQTMLFLFIHVVEYLSAVVTGGFHFLRVTRDVAAHEGTPLLSSKQAIPLSLGYNRHLLRFCPIQNSRNDHFLRKHP